MPLILLRRPAILPAVGPLCPAPTTDGSRIFARTTCTLIAFDGTLYQFDGNGPTNAPNSSGNWEFAANGVPQSSSIALERNTGGQIYAEGLVGQVGSEFDLWFLWSSPDKPQAVTPGGGPVGNVFVNQTTAATYRTAKAMLVAAAANNTLLIPLMPNGIQQWWDCGGITADGVTVTQAVGAIIGGLSFQGRGTIVFTANNGTAKNLVVTNTNDGGPSAGIRQDTNFHGLTVDGCTVSYCDHGILTGPSTGGTTTVKNSTLFNCGDLSGTNTHGSTHNAYVGLEDAVNVQNVVSYRPLSGGHCFKSRAKVGTVGTTSGNIFAQLGGDSTACFDIPCGGNYQHTNNIYHRGPNAENNRFLTFGVEMPLTGPANCPVDGRAQSFTISGSWFIDDGPLNSTATQICQNLFSSTGVNVTLTNKCKIVSNPLTSPVVLGPNVTDDGTTIHYASRAAAIAAGENIPATYSDSLSCLPPIPGADNISALLSTMIVGQWKKLTAANAGNFMAAIPPVNTGNYRAYYDSLFITTGGASSTFASDAACQGAIGVVFGNIMAFGRAGVRAGSSPRAIFTGGGHNPASGGSADSSILGFDINAACASILNATGGGSWSLQYASAAYLPQGTSNPAWSNFRPGSATTYLVPSASKDGIHRIAGVHTYGTTIWHPNGKWLHSGQFAESNDGSAAIGAAEIFDDAGSLSLFADFSGTTTINGFLASGTGNSGLDVCDLDNNLYCWQGQNASVPFALTKWANPTTAPVLSSVKSTNNQTTNVTVSDPVIIRDPINGTAKRAFWVPTASIQNFDMITDITGTPVEVASTSSPPANQGTFVSVPALSVGNPAVCRNDALSATQSTIIVWDASSHLYSITPNTSNPPRNWTFVQGSNTPSGELPTPGTGNFPRLAPYDSVRNCYYGVYMGDVYLYKPGVNGAV